MDRLTELGELVERRGETVKVPHPGVIRKDERVDEKRADNPGKA